MFTLEDFIAGVQTHASVPGCHGLPLRSERAMDLEQVRSDLHDEDISKGSNNSPEGRDEIRPSVQVPFRAG